MRMGLAPCDFIRMAFAEVGVEVAFRNQGLEETGVITAVDEAVFTLKVGDAYLEAFKNRIGGTVVGVDSQYFRPTEVELLIGDASKSRTVLGWTPKYDLPALIKDMMESDLKLMKKETYLKKAGYQILNYFE